MKKPLLLLGMLLICGCASQRPPATNPPPSPAVVGEKVPSEDAVIKDFHSMGLMNGQVNIFRCASPVRDLAKNSSATRPSPSIAADARLRMQRLYDLGIRTIISLEDPAGDADDAAEPKLKPGKASPQVVIERQAAKEVGLTYITHPVVNSGANSLQDMSDEAVLKLLDPIAADILKQAAKGGVAFHCSAGHDRTGIVAAYMRIRYQKWSADQAIDEMRRYGHNWVKLSKNGGASSWHEEHLRAIAKLLQERGDAQ
jgi:hypothetical protein